jgi:ribosome-associated heat shock protein Hsp15
MSEDRQRIDKWLWHARVVRTRSAAAELVMSGHVRINGTRIDAPSRAVRPGDVVTAGLGRTVRVMKVIGFVERRGGSETARTLYQDLSAGTEAASSKPAAAEPAARQRGTGRPTKRDRRAVDRLREPED